MAITFTFLGTGTSAGVPMIGCTCDVCTSADPRDRRDRSGAMVRYDDSAGQTRTILIDTTPELRQQMIRHQVMAVDGVVYTHAHADHTFGIDDLRRFNVVMDAPINIYAEPNTLRHMQSNFEYIFQKHTSIKKSFVADLTPNAIDPKLPFDLFGQLWTPLRLLHGRLEVLGFRIGNLAYCTDCSRIVPETYPLLEDLDVLVIDALRYRHHPTHMTVDQALTVVDEVQPKRTYFTHIAHEIRHAELEPKLPEHVYLAYDGLALEVN